MPRTFQRNGKIEAAPLDNEAILFDPATSNFFMLNHTSSFLWERLSTPMSADALAGAICDCFANISRETALIDVRAALDQMLAMELITDNDSTPV